MNDFSVSTIAGTTPGFADRVRKIHDAPKNVYIRGSHDFTQPAVAIIGSRKHTPYGHHVARALARDLAQHGFTIISGLALGIDSIAHAAAVDAGGRTSAVMPGGLDGVYPASHRHLAERMLEAGGGLLSEYPEGTTPQRYHFVARNRLVAGFSDAVVVIEANIKSGTLITAEFALDMGVPVLAVPGPVTSPLSAGTNRLIQLGAPLITSARDVLDELGIAAQQAARNHSPIVQNPHDQSIVQALKTRGPLRVAELSALTELSLITLTRRLTHLEIGGVVRSIGSNTWTLN